MRYHLFLLVWISLFTSAKAVPTADIYDMGERYFQTVGDEESIPLGIITVLAQDQQGFLWIGTQKGLIRYDGYRFRRYQFNKNNPNSIGGDFISALWPTSDGKLWVGTRHDGLSVLDPYVDKFTRFQHTPGNSASLADNYISAIVSDSSGTLWIGTHRGLDRLDPKTNQITHHQHSVSNPKGIHNNHINALLVDGSQNIWIGTEDGLSLYNQSDNHFEKKYSNPSNLNSFAGQSISKLLTANDGKIWIGTNDSGAAWIDKDDTLYRIKADPANPDKLSHSVIVDIAQPDDTEIWLATYGGGINVLDASTAQIKERIVHDISIASSINLDNIGALLVDRSGLLWIGTWGNGLNSYNPENDAFRTLRHSPGKPDSLSNPDVLSVLELSNGQIWIGTRGKGIDIFQPGIGLVGHHSPDITDPQSLHDGSVSALYESSTGEIWVGTRQAGLYRYQPEDNNFIHYEKKNGLSSNVIKRLLEDKDGDMWVGTDKGLDHFTLRTEKFKPVSIEHSQQLVIYSQLNALAKLDDGTLYAGASNGLYRIKPGESFLTKAQSDPASKSGLSHNTVVGLFVDETQTLWVSTSRGLDRLVKWNNNVIEFESINQQLGYPDQAFWANLMQDQQGLIWDGKSIINLTNSQRRELTKADGVDIGVNWYSAYSKTLSGTLLYAGTKGLLMIKPEKFKEWQYQPPLVVTQLTINGEKSSPGNSKKLNLAANTKSFGVEFSSLDFSAPEKNRYAYQLHGYDPKPIEINAENRIANYTNLDPGNYLLTIKGTNRLGNWSDQTINLSISIAPGWYQTIIFKSLTLTILAGLLYLLYFSRIRQLNQHKDALKVQVNLRTDELNKSNQSISTLSDIGNEISSTLDLDKILNTVYYHVNQLMDANVFCIGFYEQEQRQINFKLAIERGVHLEKFSISMDEKDRLAVWCVTNQLPVVINNFEQDRPKYIGNMPSVPPKAGDETASVIYWPLNVAGRTIGTITVQSFKQNAYTKHHQNIIKTLASTTAIAMDNANAYRKAQRAAEVKSTFLANMSHEIRTPMNGILGMAELVSKTSLTNEQKDYINNINISAKTLLRIINDILDFSKIEAGKMPIEEKPFSITLLMNHVYALIKTLAHNKGLEFNYFIDPDTPGDLIGDSTRLNQILLNLCSNAIKFTAQGKVDVYIRQSKNDGNNCYLNIDVVDQGIGIPEETIPKLFTNFSQADTSTTRKFGGTGLGLVISKELAKKMHGDIKVKSQQDVGSCFTLSAKLENFDINNKNHLKTFNTNNSYMIFVIDNNPEIPKKIRDFSTATNSSVEQVTDSKTLIRKIENTKNRQPVILLNGNISDKSSFLDVIQNTSPELLLRTIVYSSNILEKTSDKLNKYEIKSVIQEPLSLLEIEKIISSFPEQHSKNSVANQKRLATIKVLVAEDNKINQVIAKKILSGLGALVSIVDNGKLVIEELQSSEFDIILMDIQMPEMDGAQATKIIRKNPDFHQLPIIAMTANVLKSDIEYYKSLGMDNHISKPINTDELIDKILDCVRTKRL